MDESPPLKSECSLEEARMRAIQYRMMAATGTTRAVQVVLLRLAQRYEELAERERSGG